MAHIMVRAPLFFKLSAALHHHMYNTGSPASYTHNHIYITTCTTQGLNRVIMAPEWLSRLFEAGGVCLSQRVLLLVMVLVAIPVTHFEETVKQSLRKL